MMLANRRLSVRWRGYNVCRCYFYKILLAWLCLSQRLQNCGCRGWQASKATAGFPGVEEELKKNDCLPFLLGVSGGTAAAVP